MIDTKFDIIGTFSKMCDDREIVMDLIQGGTAGFRFSFSKDTPAYHFNKAKEVIELGNSLGKEIQVIMDLPGIKPRIMSKELEIEKDKTYEFTSVKDADGLHVTHYDDISNIQKNDIIITGDGELSFRVVETHDSGFSGKAILSGILTNNRGITIEGKIKKSRYLTDEEKGFIKLNAENDWIFDKIYYSFTDSSSCISEVIDFCKKLSAENIPEMIPKIETISGVDNLADIIQACDEILIGRGDLGIQCGLVNFYKYQQMAIRVSKQHKKKIVIGTQLFEKATREWLPYRAEISDLSHLLSIGIDGILLEADTIAARNPSRGIESILRLVDNYRE